MDNQITNKPDTDKPAEGSVLPELPSTGLSPDQLLAGLYFLFDSFARAQLDFFLVKQTARDAIANRAFTGKQIDIGIRQNEWASDAKDILFTYFEQEGVKKLREIPGVITYHWQGTPFVLHIYADSEPLLALNTIAYAYESWHVPNQFERFEKEFDHD